VKLFGVIGHPVAHSLSPLMHNTAFAALGLDCTYDAYDVSFESLRTAIQDFRDRGFVGLNVTLPHKERIISFLDHVTPEAKAIGAVNTVTHRDGRLVGCNTDAEGFSRSLEPLRSQIAGTTVLLFGAGGGARAAAYALLVSFSPERLIIANRSQQRAEDFAARCEAFGTITKIEADGLVDWEIRRAVEASSLIVNATSLGMAPDVNRSPLMPEVTFRCDQVVIDLIYTPMETALLRKAAGDGARTISGLEMFLYQGARSFELWTGQPMPIERVRPVIEKELRNPTT
jgi:shikimate dehydrogenase